MMLGSVRVPDVPISHACSSGWLGDGSQLGIIGDRVPVGTSVGSAIGAAVISSWGWDLSSMASCGGGHAAAAVSGEVRGSGVNRNTLPSRHIRCRITPMRLASATMARFFPRRCATCIPQALSQEG